MRERVFDAGEVSSIIGLCEDVLAQVVEHGRGRRYTVGSYTFEPAWSQDLIIKWEGDTDIVHGLEPLAHLSPELTEWGLDRRFLDPMIDLVGDDGPVLFTEKLNLKRPRIGGVNPLHQDHPYWVDSAGDPERTATAMLFLDDASLGNGTLQVVPGSHKKGPWRRRTDSDPFGNFEIDPTEEEGATPRARRGAGRLRRLLRVVPRAQVGAEHLRERAAQPAVQLPARRAAALRWRACAANCGAASAT